MTKKKDPNLTAREQLILSWKNRDNYKGYDRSKGSSFNSWRAIIYSKKGKAIGYPDSWREYKNFMDDVSGEWEKGKVALRLDTSKPHGAGNTFWGNKGEENTSRLIRFEYNGITKTLLEWSRDLNINYNGLRIRYFRHKNEWSAKDILYGRSITKKVVLKTSKKHKIIHMCSAYKLRDKKRGLTSDINFEWMYKFCKQPCFYCGDTERIGLDRIDNTKGHTKDNVVPCCYACNCARNDNFTHEEMKIIGKAIREVKCKRLQENN